MWKYTTAECNLNLNVAYSEIKNLLSLLCSEIFNQ